MDDNFPSRLKDISAVETAYWKLVKKSPDGKAVRLW